MNMSKFVKTSFDVTINELKRFLSGQFSTCTVFLQISSRKRFHASTQLRTLKILKLEINSIR